MTHAIGVSGTSGGQPATWRPQTELSWSESFGPARTEFGAKHHAYQASIPVEGYDSISKRTFLDYFLGTHTLDRFQPRGSAANELPIAVIENDNGWFGNRDRKFLAMPTTAIRAGEHSGNIGMPKVGDVVRGGYTSHGFGDDPHGRIVALMDRSSIARFAGTGETTVRSMPAVERAALRLGPLGLAGIGAGALAAAVGGTALAMRD